MLATIHARSRSVATFNIASAFPKLPLLPVLVLFGIACTICGISLRWIIDHVWDGAGPFALMVPFVLVATLFGKWQAGLLTAVLSSLYAWYFVLPMPSSWAFEMASDGPRVVVNVLAAFFVVALAELFRRNMWQALDDREMLLREIEHRMKNNFASVAGMLRLQMREYADDSTISHALQAALGRVESYAIANSFLYRGAGYSGTVNLSGYLAELCANLERTAVADKPVRIETDVPNLTWERDRAIVIGLLVNELVTNSYKHAFPGRTDGVIKVRMQGTEQDWSLDVSDNGIGFVQQADGGSLGHKLIAALAVQAGATVEMSSGDRGTRYRIGTMEKPVEPAGVFS
jgi:two-component sensor histidine kinase